MAKNDMTEGRIGSQIVRFALPIMGGIFLQMLYSTVDGVVVGNFVSEAALGAVNTAGTFCNLLLAVANGLSGGGSVYIAQLYGARKRQQMKCAVSTMLFLMIGLGLLFTAAGELAAGSVLAHILAVPEDAYGHALFYLRVFLLGLTFQFLYNTFAAILRAVGDSAATMLFLILSSVVNIVLDLMFVAVFRWGVAGAAAATVIAQGLSVLACVLYIRKKQPLLVVARKEWQFDVSVCGILLKTGLPMSFQNVISNIGTLSIQRLTNSYGSTFMAGVAAAGKFDMYASVPIMSFSQAVFVFTGQNVGAGDYGRVRRGCLCGLAMSYVGAIVMGLCFWFLGEDFVRMFGCEGAAVEAGRQYLHFLAFALLFAPALFVTRSMMQGAGDVFSPTVITFIALGLRVCSAYAMAATEIGQRAVWYSIGVDFGSCSIMLVLWLMTGHWKKKALVKSTGKSAGAAES